MRYDYPDGGHRPPRIVRIPVARLGAVMPDGTPVPDEYVRFAVVHDGSCVVTTYATEPEAKAAIERGDQ